MQVGPRGWEGGRKLHIAVVPSPKLACMEGHRELYTEDSGLRRDPSPLPCHFGDRCPNDGGDKAVHVRAGDPRNRSYEGH